MRCAYFPCVLTFLLTVSISFASGQDTTVEAGPLVDVRVASLLDGWSPNPPDSYHVFTPGTLFDIIDGGAEVYIDGGFVSGNLQMIAAENGENAQLFVYDFVTPAKAVDFFIGKTGFDSTSVSLPAPFDSLSIVEEVIGGVYVYAVLDRYFCELTLTGAAPPETKKAFAAELLAALSAAMKVDGDD